MSMWSSDFACPDAAAPSSVPCRSALGFRSAPRGAVTLVGASASSQKDTACECQSDAVREFVIVLAERELKLEANSQCEATARILYVEELIGETTMFTDLIVR